LIFSPQREITGQDIEVIHLDGDRKPVSLVKTPANEMAPRFSPDGKWVAYASDESGRQEIYVTNYPSASAKWQISTAGGFAPFWSADGKQIYFILKGLVYVSDVHAGSSFAADAPRRFAPVTVPVDEMAVGDDGTMVLVREIDADDAPVSVVMNWKTLLREH
jgi:Tol biopolymer transport system component